MSERMICAYCVYNDGAVYTSIPPKYKCTITNEFHFGLDNCDVEFAPVKHGRWIDDCYDQMDGGAYKITVCSVCGTPNPVSNYCPNCGAKME